MSRKAGFVGTSNPRGMRSPPRGQEMSPATPIKNLYSPGEKITPGSGTSGDQTSPLAMSEVFGKEIGERLDALKHDWNVIKYNQITKKKH